MARFRFGRASLIISTLLALTAHGIACSDEEGGPPGVEAGAGDELAATPPSDAGVTLGPNEACLAYMQAVCARFAECGQRLADCSSLTAFCPDYFFAEGATYTVESLAACAEERRRQNCDDLLFGGRLPACVRAGTLEAGAPCRFTPQCASGQCAQSAGIGSCGTCAAVKPPGTGCPGVGETCGLNRHCPSEDAGCVDGPVVTKAVGEACTSKDRCTWPSRCFGAAADASAGTCTVTQDGGPCAFVAGSATPACTSALACVEREGERVCAPGAALGDPCSTAPCGAGLYCDGTQRCAARGEVGQPCSDLQTCTEGLSCVQGASGNVCAAGAEIGAPCGRTSVAGGPAVDIACAAGACLVVALADGGITRTCAARYRGIGEICNLADAPCLSPLVCGVSGRCELPACLPDSGT